MIVCSCNVLSDKQILATLQLGAGPQAVSQVYRCLGCAPRCGRCLEAVCALLAQAHLDNCKVGCAACPATDAHHGEDEVAEDAPVFAAAECAARPRVKFNPDGKPRARGRARSTQ